ncbi:MAG: hypothetical protein WC371_03200 [Parachlamydiales bacterium]|jgi:Flp pilus assembly protein TadB
MVTSVELDCKSPTYQKLKEENEILKEELRVVSEIATEALHKNKELGEAIQNERAEVGRERKLLAEKRQETKQKQERFDELQKKDESRAYLAGAGAGVSVTAAAALAVCVIGGASIGVVATIGVIGVTALSFIAFWYKKK